MVIFSSVGEGADRQVQVLATVPDAFKLQDGGILNIISHCTGLPAELCLMILSHLSYRDFVLLALTSKFGANAVLNDPVFETAAAREETEHSALGHYGFVMRCYPGSKQSRSKLRCSHYTCPFHMRSLRKWSRKVEKEKERLEIAKARRGKTQKLLGILKTANVLK